MKRFLLFILLIGITVITRAQDSKNAGTPPVKSGTTRPQPNVAPLLPVRKSDNNTQPKNTQLITVPFRKADPSGTSPKVADKIKTDQTKKDRRFLSDFSAKEAGELLVRQNDSARKIKGN
ncbi:hypothetical protein ACX0G9_04175 [Flavitalea flava]